MDDDQFYDYVGTEQVIEEKTQQDQQIAEQAVKESIPEQNQTHVDQRIQVIGQENWQSKNQNEESLYQNTEYGSNLNENTHPIQHNQIAAKQLPEIQQFHNDPPTLEIQGKQDGPLTLQTQRKTEADILRTTTFEKQPIQIETVHRNENIQPQLVIQQFVPQAETNRQVQSQTFQPKISYQPVEFQQPQATQAQQNHLEPSKTSQKNEQSPQKPQKLQQNDEDQEFGDFQESPSSSTIPSQPNRSENIIQQEAVRQIQNPLKYDSQNLVQQHKNEQYNLAHDQQYIETPLNTDESHQIPTKHENQPEPPTFDTSPSTFEPEAATFEPEPIQTFEPTKQLTRQVTLQDELATFIKSLPNYSRICQRSFINAA